MTTREYHMSQCLMAIHIAKQAIKELTVRDNEYVMEHIKPDELKTVGGLLYEWWERIYENEIKGKVV